MQIQCTKKKHSYANTLQQFVVLSSYTIFGIGLIRFKKQQVEFCNICISFRTIIILTRFKKIAL
jgi:hypothetical protein